MDKKGFIVQERIPVRYKGEFLETSVDLVDFIDLTPRQVVGVSASLIPFLANDEANRALMGTHMQCQAVPLLLPQAPIVGTGMEKEIAESMGWVKRAEKEGEVVYVDAQKISIKDKDNNKITYPIHKFKRTSQSTCYSQRPLIAAGQKVKKGELLIDGPACENG